ncbi:MAG: hypothetical protein WC506_02680 [Candidatus Micrarchaeia archaeon]
MRKTWAFAFIAILAMGIAAAQSPPAQPINPQMCPAGLTSAYLLLASNTSGSDITFNVVLFSDNGTSRAPLPNEPVYVVWRKKSSGVVDGVCKVITRDSPNLNVNGTAVVSLSATECVQVAFFHCYNSANDILLRDCIGNESASRALGALPLSTVPMHLYNLIPECPASEGGPQPLTLSKNYTSAYSDYGFCPVTAGNTQEALCWPILLVFGMLLGAMFVVGRNPLQSFDLSSPRFDRGRQYQMRNMNVAVQVTPIIGALLEGAKEVGVIKSANKAGDELVSDTGEAAGKGLGKVLEFVGVNLVNVVAKNVLGIDTRKKEKDDKEGDKEKEGDKSKKSQDIVTPLKQDQKGKQGPQQGGSGPGVKAPDKLEFVNVPDVKRGGTESGTQTNFGPTGVRPVSSSGFRLIFDSFFNLFSLVGGDKAQKEAAAKFYSSFVVSSDAGVSAGGYLLMLRKMLRDAAAGFAGAIEFAPLRSFASGFVSGIGLTSFKGEMQVISAQQLLDKLKAALKEKAAAGQLLKADGTAVTAAEIDALSLQNSKGMRDMMMALGVASPLGVLLSAIANASTLTGGMLAIQLDNKALVEYINELKKNPDTLKLGLSLEARMQDGKTDATGMLLALASLGDMDSKKLEGLVTIKQANSENMGDIVRELRTEVFESNKKLGRGLEDALPDLKDASSDIFSAIGKMSDSDKAKLGKLIDTYLSNKISGDFPAAIKGIFANDPKATELLKKLDDKSVDISSLKGQLLALCSGDAERTQALQNVFAGLDKSAAARDGTTADKIAFMQESFKAMLSAPGFSDIAGAQSMLSVFYQFNSSSGGKLFSQDLAASINGCMASLDSLSVVKNKITSLSYLVGSGDVFDTKTASLGNQIERLSEMEKKFGRADSINEKAAELLSEKKYSGLTFEDAKNILSIKQSGGDPDSKLAAYLKEQGIDADAKGLSQFIDSKNLWLTKKEGDFISSSGSLYSRAELEATAKSISGMIETNNASITKLQSDIYEMSKKGGMEDEIKQKQEALLGLEKENRDLQSKKGMVLAGGFGDVVAAEFNGDSKVLGSGAFALRKSLYDMHDIQAGIGYAMDSVSQADKSLMQMGGMEALAQANVQRMVSEMREQLKGAQTNDEKLKSDLEFDKTLEVKDISNRAKDAETVNAGLLGKVAGGYEGTIRSDIDKEYEQKAQNMVAVSHESKHPITIEEARNALLADKNEAMASRLEEFSIATKFLQSESSYDIKKSLLDRQLDVSGIEPLGKAGQDLKKALNIDSYSDNVFNYISGSATVNMNYSLSLSANFSSLSVAQDCGFSANFSQTLGNIKAGMETGQLDNQSATLAKSAETVNSALNAFKSQYYSMRDSLGEQEFTAAYAQLDKSLNTFTACLDYAATQSPDSYAAPHLYEMDMRMLTTSANNFNTLIATLENEKFLKDVDSGMKLEGGDRFGSMSAIRGDLDSQSDLIERYILEKKFDIQKEGETVGAPIERTAGDEYRRHFDAPIVYAGTSTGAELAAAADKVYSDALEKYKHEHDGAAPQSAQEFLKFMEENKVAIIVGSASHEDTMQDAKNTALAEKRGQAGADLFVGKIAENMAKDGLAIAPGELSQYKIYEQKAPDQKEMEAYMEAQKSAADGFSHKLLWRVDEAKSEITDIAKEQGFKQGKGGFETENIYLDSRTNTVGVKEGRAQDLTPAELGVLDLANWRYSNSTDDVSQAAYIGTDKRGKNLYLVRDESSPLEQVHEQQRYVEVKADFSYSTQGVSESFDNKEWLFAQAQLTGAKIEAEHTLLRSHYMEQAGFLHDSEAIQQIQKIDHEIGRSRASAFDELKSTSQYQFSSSGNVYGNEGGKEVLVKDHLFSIGDEAAKTTAQLQNMSSMETGIQSSQTSLLMADQMSKAIPIFSDNPLYKTIEAAELKALSNDYVKYGLGIGLAITGNIGLAGNLGLYGTATMAGSEVFSLNGFDTALQQDLKTSAPEDITLGAGTYFDTASRRISSQLSGTPYSDQREYFKRFSLAPDDPGRHGAGSGDNKGGTQQRMPQWNPITKTFQ